MLKMKLFGMVAVLFCLVSFQKAQAFNQYFTHQLAIVYFAGHQPAGYTIEGYGPHPSPEYFFMAGFLSGLENANPSLTRFMIPKGYGYESSFTDLHGFSNGDSFRFVKKEIDELTEDCPFSQTIKNQSSPDGKSTILMSRETEYYLRAPCTTQYLTMLQKAGFTTFKIEEGTSADSASFVLTNGLPQDLSLLRGQLLNVQGLEFLVLALQASKLPQYPEVPKGGQTIRPGLYFDHSHWGSTTDPIKLKFVHGWGDCMAGCMNSHTWDVTATPSAGANGQFTFTYDIKETGSPLGEE